MELISTLKITIGKELGNEDKYFISYHLGFFQLHLGSNNFIIHYRWNLKADYHSIVDNTDSIKKNFTQRENCRYSISVPSDNIYKRSLRAPTGEA